MFDELFIKKNTPLALILINDIKNKLEIGRSIFLETCVFNKVLPRLLYTNELYYNVNKNSVDKIKHARHKTQRYNYRTSVFGRLTTGRPTHKLWNLLH